MTDQGPGFRNQPAARTAFRILGVVVTVVALFFLVRGITTFVGQMGSTAAPSADGMAEFIGGGFGLVVGLVLLNLGFMGAGARYSAGELAPVAKDTWQHITDGSSAKCSGCGSDNPDDARFCNGCGRPQT